MNRLTVVPLNFNGLELLKKSTESWLVACRGCPHSATLHILDNASEDGSLGWLGEAHPDIPVHRMDKNLILQAYNVFLKLLDTEYVLILNNDVHLEPDSLGPLVDRLDQAPDALGVNPMITEGEGGVRQRKGGRFFHGHLALLDLGPGAGGTLLLHGAAMLVRRERFLELGGFDPAFFYFEDNDLSYRAWRAGYTCWFEPESVVHHTPSSTTDSVYRGVVNRRALKEKGSLLFVLKNIRRKRWLWNAYGWTVFKCLKMVLTFDRSRWWAMRQVVVNRHKVTSLKANWTGLTDQEILDKVVKVEP
jgi:GT2 family glycosyltransferase